MNIKFTNHYSSVVKKTLILLLLCSGMLHSCKDSFLEENLPSWLGESIYGELQKRGNYTNYLRLIDDVGYTEVLQRTGSKTLFVADDAAFSRFYTSDNLWGIKSYDDFTTAQKNLLLNSSMINNAYLLNMLSSTEGPNAGQSLRNETAVSVFDSVSFEKSSLPDKPFWSYYRNKGLFLMKDKTAPVMLHFLSAQMSSMGITDNDFSIITNGKAFSSSAGYVYGESVKEKDITCQNGYIHVLNDVLIPPSNMAEMLRSLPQTTQFSSILETFSRPYYDAAMTSQFHALPAHQSSSDSVFVKRYFSQNNAYGSEYSTTPDKSETGVLSYDPGWNQYSPNGTGITYQNDMGAMFVPTNEAMNTYFNSGGGKFLKDEFGTWENVPSLVLADLVNNHMKTSFKGTVPSKFAKVLDDAQEPMGLSTQDIVKAYLANNGVIYLMNKVYAPASYSSVMAPTLVKNNMRSIYYGIKYLQYDAYLLAMDAYYSFFVPTDDVFYYIDPLSLKQTQPVVYKFWYSSSATGLKTRATKYKYNTSTGAVGDSIGVVTDATILSNRLEDILNYHVVVGNVEDGKSYYLTKGGGTIKISGTGENMKAYGGGDIQRETEVTVEKIYDQTKATNGKGNGKTYIVNAPLQAPVQSVYKILSSTPEFSEFYNLLLGNSQWSSAEEAIYAIFTSGGLDYNVSFFSRYHYTVYVPTNTAIQAAIANGLPTWKEINALPDDQSALKETLTKKLLKFLKYHFQDNSVFIGGTPQTNMSFETAALNTSTKRFYTLTVNSNSNGLSLKTNTGGTADVLKIKGASGTDLYNIMARDYVFNTANVATATTIEASSFAVIHQINNVLYCE